MDHIGSYMIGDKYFDIPVSSLTTTDSVYYMVNEDMLYIRDTSNILVKDVKTLDTFKTTSSNFGDVYLLDNLQVAMQTYCALNLNRLLKLNKLSLSDLFKIELDILYYATILKITNDNINYILHKRCGHIVVNNCKYDILQLSLEQGTAPSLIRGLYEI